MTPLRYCSRERHFGGKVAYRRDRDLREATITAYEPYPHGAVDAQARIAGRVWFAVERDVVRCQCPDASDKANRGAMPDRIREVEPSEVCSRWRTNTGF